MRAGMLRVSHDPRERSLDRASCRMALRATVFKASLVVADMDRDRHATHALTIARHPSETDERMMVRVLMFALLSTDTLAFGRGLSDVDEPDLIDRDLTGAIDVWVEVGLPDERSILKACGRARRVVVAVYGTNADAWWRGVGAGLARARNLRVLQWPSTRRARWPRSRPARWTCKRRSRTA